MSDRRLITEDMPYGEPQGVRKAPRLLTEIAPDPVVTCQDCRVALVREGDSLSCPKCRQPAIV